MPARPPRAVKYLMWVCSFCNSGPWNSKTTTQCLSCYHVFDKNTDSYDKVYK